MRWTFLLLYMSTDLTILLRFTLLWGKRVWTRVERKVVVDIHCEL